MTPPQSSLDAEYTSYSPMYTASTWWEIQTLTGPPCLVMFAKLSLDHHCLGEGFRERSNIKLWLLLLYISLLVRHLKLMSAVFRWSADMITTSELICGLIYSLISKSVISLIHRLFWSDWSSLMLKHYSYTLQTAQLLSARTGWTLPADRVS